MTANVTPDPKRDRLQAAFDYASAQTRAGVPAETIIAGLVADHCAAHRTRWNGSTLRCAGVAASCTYNPGKPLLDNWSKTAGLRLIGAAMEGFGSE